MPRVEALEVKIKPHFEHRPWENRNIYGDLIPYRTGTDALSDLRFLRSELPETEEKRAERVQSFIRNGTAFCTMVRSDWERSFFEPPDFEDNVAVREIMVSKGHETFEINRVEKERDLPPEIPEKFALFPIPLKLTLIQRTLDALARGDPIEKIGEKAILMTQVFLEELSAPYQEKTLEHFTYPHV